MSNPNLVVLIDDDKTFNFINERIIRMSTFAKNIQSFVNANTALKELKANVATHPEVFPMVIFLDINMPIMDGWEFLDELKSFPENILKCLKVYMLTSSIDENDIEKSKQYQVVYDFISKPLTTDKLVSLKEDTGN